MSDDDSPAPGHGGRVLVVDDNPGTVGATVRYLALSGFEARGAGSAAEALATAERWAPQAAVLDLGLPDRDGFELAEALRERAPSAPVFVALSGMNDPATRNRVREAGFAGFVAKPARLDELATLLRAVLSPSPAGGASRDE